MEEDHMTWRRNIPLSTMPFSLGLHRPWPACTFWHYKKLLLAACKTFCRTSPAPPRTKTACQAKRQKHMGRQTAAYTICPVTPAGPLSDTLGSIPQTHTHTPLPGSFPGGRHACWSHLGMASEEGGSCHQWEKRRRRRASMQYLSLRHFFSCLWSLQAKRQNST